MRACLELCAQIDPRSDLYALGATLYHLLTGVPPIDSATRADAFLGRELDPLLPVNHLNPKVPYGIPAALMKAMEPHRNDRFSSATEMLEALRDAKGSTVVDWQARKDEQALAADEVPQDKPLWPATEVLIREEAEDEQRGLRDARQAQEKPERKAREDAERNLREEERKTQGEAERLKPQRERDQEAREKAESQKLQEEGARRAREEAEKLKQQQEELRKLLEREDAERRQPKTGQPEQERRSDKLFLRIGGGLRLAVLLIWGIAVILNRSDKPMSSSSTTEPDTTKKPETGALKPSLFPTPAIIYKVSLSDDGRVLASTGDESVARVWTLGGKKQLGDPAHKGRCVAVSPDGSLVASGSKDGSIRIWRVSDGELMNAFEAHSDDIFGIGFSLDGSDSVFSRQR